MNISLQFFILEVKLPIAGADDILLLREILGLKIRFCGKRSFAKFLSFLSYIENNPEKTS